jgi:gluconokinase
MRICAARGFSDLKMADLARELRCSVATLYKLAPSKTDLVILALQRWGEQLLTGIDARAAACSTPSEQARVYYREGADGLRALSPAFRRDTEYFEATRRAYREIVSNRFIERFSALLEEAAEAGEIRPVNVRFTVGMFRYIAFAIRDEDLLAEAGLTAREALLEVDRMLWDGMSRSSVLPHRFLIVMGVAGSGKTTVGQALASRLGWDFYDADDFHSPENLAKMAAGIALGDEDRRPWLATLHDLISSCLARRTPGVLACSALKERYRQTLLAGNCGTEIVYLRGSYDLVLPRMNSRPGHCMKAELLQSQFEDLEEPADALAVDAGLPVDRIVETVIQHMETGR